MIPQSVWSISATACLILTSLFARVSTSRYFLQGFVSSILLERLWLSVFIMISLVLCSFQLGVVLAVLLVVQFVELQSSFV